MSSMKFQIGKSGITEGVIDSLALAFKNHKQVRIIVLKSTGRENIKEMAQGVLKRLEDKTGLEYHFRVLGFTIILNKGKKVDT